jgi:23S rRNA (pseudouridine1915-N3)-methyltransferase
MVAAPTVHFRCPTSSGIESMQVVVIAVGKVKERYWREALAEYAKRLSGYVKLELVEVADEPTPDHPSDVEREQVLAREADKMEKWLRDRDAIVALDIRGKACTSEAWSKQFAQLESGGYGRIVFLIGGSLGLADRLLKRAVFRWSFGPITLPHQLARVLLLEQIYRGIKIARGEPYHK